MRVFGRVLIALLTTTPAYAEVGSWEHLFYKVDVPNELVVAHSVDACPLSYDRLEVIVDDVLASYQIEPKSALSRFDLFLAVRLDCKAKGAEFIFNLMVRFGRSYRDEAVVHLVTDYGDFGIGRKEGLEVAVRSSVEKALEEYAEVNFEGLLQGQFGSRASELDEKIDEAWEALEAIRTKHEGTDFVEWVKLSSWTSTVGDIGGVIVGDEETGTQLFISRDRGENERGELTGYSISIFQSSSGINELWNTGSSTNKETNLRDVVRKFEEYLDTLVEAY